MQIDIWKLTCAMHGFSTKANESETDTKKLQCDFKVSFDASPDFLDKFLDGHNTGAQPSDVFWRREGDDKTRYVRYFGIDKVTLIVPEKETYRVKFSVRVGKDDTPATAEKKAAWTMTLEQCELRGLFVTFSVNSCVVTAKVRAWPRDQGEVGMLASLTQSEDLEVSIQNHQQDLMTMPAGEPPRPVEDAEEEEQGPNEAVRTWPADKDEGNDDDDDDDEDDYGVEDDDLE
jgi:hypothetical protein